MDFGLAMEADQSRLTQANTTFGTVSYAPPEWIQPDTLDPEKWDIYSIGVVIWEMLRGQIAFPVSGTGSARQQAMQVIIAKQDHPPLDPGPAYHDDLRTLVRELTASDPGDRPASMAEIHARVLALDPSPRTVTQDTLTPPSTTPVGASDSTWVDQNKAIRPEWATALKATPVPAQPSRRGSEADTLVTGESPVEPPQRRGASWGLAAGGVLAGVFGLALAAFALVTWRSQLSSPPATRPVQVVVAGLDAGTEAALTLDGQPERSRTSWVWRFGNESPGAHTLAWAIGSGCAIEDCPGASCPSWCGTGTEPIEVKRGQGAQVVEVHLHPPPERTVDVHLPADLDHVPVGVRLGEISRRNPGPVAHFERIRPGAYDLEVDAGACDTPDHGCQADAECPPGCSSWTSHVEVPWGKGPWDVTAAVKPPAPPAASRHPVPSPGPAPAPSELATTASRAPALAPTPRASEAPSGSSGPPVTVAAFATWLSSHPEWQRDKAMASDVADDGYLGGWQGAQPPAGPTDQPIRGVSWYAAAAYCRDHGGLAPLSAPPLTWDESGGLPYVEWRQQGGRAAWRSSDGRSSDKTPLDEANSFTGFRCAH